MQGWPIFIAVLKVKKTNIITIQNRHSFHFLFFSQIEMSFPLSIFVRPKEIQIPCSCISYTTPTIWKHMSTCSHISPPWEDAFVDRLGGGEGHLETAKWTRQAASLRLRQKRGGTPFKQWHHNARVYPAACEGYGEEEAGTVRSQEMEGGQIV